MNKSSTSYLLKCYIWLVNTIARGPVSRQEIDSLWAKSSVNDYKTDSIPENTFHRWRNIAEDLFDIEIKCNAHSEYYIDMENNELKNSYVEGIKTLFERWKRETCLTLLAGLIYYGTCTISLLTRCGKK